MTRGQVPVVAKRYRGFVSYSQRDAPIARRLHAALERYRVPRGFEARSATERRLGRFFRDDDELAASEALGAAIKGALDDSECLIVVASLHAARSKWVEAEVAHFRRRPDGRVLAVVVAGAPNSGNPETECFPPSLRSSGVSTAGLLEAGEGPLAPDLTKQPFERALIRVVAGILEIPFDTLWNRERRRRRLRRTALLGLAAVAGIGVFAGASEVQRQFDLRALVAHSMDISREGWQNAWRPSYFDPALRAALAAVPASGAFERGDAGDGCDLARPVESGACALRLSGLALASTVVHGAVPSRDQDNIRNDIADGGADNFSRRMITGETHVRDLAFSADGTRLAMVSNRGELVVIETGSHAVVRRTSLPGRGKGAVALNEDGTVCVVAIGDGTVIGLDVAGGETIGAAALGAGLVDAIVPDGDGWVVLAGGNRLVALDGGLEERWRRQTVESDVYNVAPLATAPRKLAVLESYGGRGLVEVVDLANRQVTQVQDPGIGDGVGQVKALAVSPDARLLALGGNGSGGGSRAGGQVLSLASGTEMARLIGHHGEIYATRFLPGGGVVTGGSDFSIRFWDVDTGAETLRLIGHVAPIQDLAPSPDGRWLASASLDGTVRLWQLPPYRASDARRLRHDLCSFRPGTPSSVSTTLPAGERAQSRAFAGRPRDVCRWRGLDSAEGWRQALTVAAVRWVGLDGVDYPEPPPGP